MSHLATFLAGLLFAAGLVLGGMTQPAKVINFLDVSGSWDPSLAFVMAGALLVYGLALRVVTRRETPMFSGEFMIPTRQDLPPRLFLGAALFGVGWALAGFCPGPAVVALGSGMSEAFWFVPGLLGGMAAYRVFSTRVSSKRSAS